MKLKIFLLCGINILLFHSYGQFAKITNTDYYMSFEPVIGSLHGTSNIAYCINPNLTLQSQGFIYGVDWVSARWANVEDDYLVPKVQVPIKVKYMRGKNNKGLKTSDGTFFPEEERLDTKDKPWAPFTYFDLSIDFYYSPYYFKAGPTIITPKFGFGVDLAKHAYNIDLSKYLDKPGTVPTLAADISEYGTFYSYTFWEDLYGINLGTYVNVTKNIFIDAGWEFYPGRFMTKLAKNTINNGLESKSSKLNRLSIKGQYRVISWFSVFVKYEHSNYQFNGPVYDGGDQAFYQKYSNVLFGITLGGPR